MSPDPVSPHPVDPDPEAAVTRHWSGRLLDAGLRQHGTGTDTEPPHPADFPSAQPSCPPEDAR
ncbi:hypothetical protein GCM10009759_66220 [Kitasatospora saccharophila]|uniref:Uncharacterized protein n=1 Tax=Kitasatospora saccharophila TaxID=407973 RepID=A0ABN2Y1A2_9ACTN